MEYPSARGYSFFSWPRLGSDAERTVPPPDQLATLAHEVAGTAEQQESSTDPQAMVLGQVTVGEAFSNDRVYIIEPPTGSPLAQKAAAFFVKVHGHEPLYTDDIAVLRPERKKDPYEPHSGTYASMNFNREVTDDIEGLVAHVREHGIKTDAARIRFAQGRNDAQVAALANLPLTSRLAATPEAEAPAPPQEQYFAPTKPREHTGRRLGAVAATLQTNSSRDSWQAPAEPIEKVPLPTKPLAECSVADLKDLTERQLATMLVKASRYDDRKISIFTAARGVFYRLHIGKPEDVRPEADKYSGTIDPEDIVVGDAELTEADKNLKSRIIDIKLPNVEYGSDYTLEKAFPAINAKLAAIGAPSLSFYDLHHENREQIMMYWRSSAQRILEQHRYGDGDLFMKHESAEGMLAREVQDLQELGLDFDDITNKLEELQGGIREAWLPEYYRKWDPEEAAKHPNNGPFRVTSMEDHYVPSFYTYEYTPDTSITALTKQWKYCVISVPFKGVESSVLDHEISKVGQRGWHMPIAETSLSLYKHRVVEGYYMPHYRISGARAVWALQMGTPEQQAKALELDWKRCTETLEEAGRRRDRTAINTALNYMIEYFPRDDSPWRANGFPGYSYMGTTFPTLRDMLLATKDQYEHITYPKGAFMVGSQTTIRNID
jgi:hypothetical protein